MRLVEVWLLNEKIDAGLLADRLKYIYEGRIVGGVGDFLGISRMETLASVMATKYCD